MYTAQTAIADASIPACIKFIVVSNYSLLFINTPNSIVHDRFNASKTTINPLNDAPNASSLSIDGEREKEAAKRLQTIEKGVNDARIKCTPHI